MNEPTIQQQPMYPNKSGKVCVVVVREYYDVKEVLVFRHESEGVQFVKGGIEPGEHIYEAALRELAEESGIDDAEVVRYLGCFHPGYGSKQWEIVQVKVSRLLPERWLFFASDDGGQWFEFFWHPLKEEPTSEWNHVYINLLDIVRASLEKPPDE